MRPPFERQTGEGACGLGAGSPERWSSCCLVYVSAPHLEVEEINTATRGSGCRGQFAGGRPAEGQIELPGFKCELHHSHTL